MSPCTFALGQSGGMANNGQYLQLPDYDPRRLFPFGLSPIPEVPSELASEVSSIASYSPTPSLDDSDTEIESVRGGSIMYSGSCDSIKTNATIHGKSSSDSDTDTHDSSDQSTEDEAEIENIPVDTPKPTIAEEEEVRSPPVAGTATSYANTSDTSNEAATKENTVEDEAEPDAEHPTIPCDMVSGAATASEIFRHLQATRGKQEVTTELAKILTVLKSTLNNEEKESSSSEDESPASDDKATRSVPLGKPPKHPQKIKFSKNSIVSPAIQARIRELENNKKGNPKEEMNLLSKILVHLLCSAKTTAAAQELKRIIRQFKEVAKVAMEEGDDEVLSLRSNSRASSRNSRRRARSRTASGNSNISGNSETDSMNTLTPGDSKSSGTDDEIKDDPNVGKIRFTSACDKNNESCVSYTLTLPLKVSSEQVEEENEDDNDEYEDDEEWEWEYDDGDGESTKDKNESSGSSRNLTPSEAKSDVSTGSTRKILSEMELGAYNTNSEPSHSTPITEEEDIMVEEMEDLKYDKQKKKVVEKAENSEHLLCHLSETFKVLSDTYKIITTGNSPECVDSQSPSNGGNKNEKPQQSSDKSFEDILDEVSGQCVQLETEIMRSSRQSTEEPEALAMSSRPSSRPGSKQSSRPPSVNIVRPPSQAKSESAKAQAVSNLEDEEDWGDEDEWEYYYEEEYPEEGTEDTTPASSKVESRPNSRTRLRSRPASVQEIADFKMSLSRPASRQVTEHESRPASRIVLRPKSRGSSRPASRAVSRCSVKQCNEAEEEEEDWGDDDEWEYYYEDEVEEEEKVIVSRPVSRQNVASRPASRQNQVQRAYSRQEIEIKRVPSRQGIEVARVPSRQEIEIKRIPSRQASRPNSRSASRAKSALTNAGGEGGDDYDDEDGWEYYYEEDEEEATQTATVNNLNIVTNIQSQPKLPSRPNSRTTIIVQSRPNSRTGSRPASRTGSRPSSRATSRLFRTASSLGNVDEEEEYEWYYEDDCDPELARFGSPTLTTAPTTRATSPFPDEKGNVEQVRGTGFSCRKISTIQESEESTPVPNAQTPTNKDNNLSTPVQESRSNTVMSKTPTQMQTGYLNPMAGISVCLAAEYLGQDAQQLAASLPVQFIEENQVVVSEKKKKRHKDKSKDKDAEGEEGSGGEKKKKKKKKDKKFLPKVGVKELASRLEPVLFQDEGVGNKMVMTKEEASGVIIQSKRKTQKQELEELAARSASIKSPVCKKNEEERKSVKDLVELMSTKNLGHEKKSGSVSPPHQNIPSISVSSQMVAPPIPPPPPAAYYSSQSHQYPQYQPYTIDVHAQHPQYSQYPPQSPNGHYQQYPPHSPYHQYPPQQYYQGYPPPPPPPIPPQHYQQYNPQQYQYHPQQLQPYPGYSQGYPPPPQPMIYPSETNDNQVKVVSGGQTTIVTMRQKGNANKSKEQRSQHNKSPDEHRASPNDSEAYGTGSTGSDQTEGQAAAIDHDEGKEGDDGQGKTPHKRHSRLFKLLQDSDYTDSDADSRADYSRISMKNMEDNHGRESDIDSVCSGLERTGIERKHSFRSHKSSNKESDNESVASGGLERKISPTSVQSGVKHRRFLQLNLQSSYEPSSSELSTPNSPTGPGPERRKSQSKPPSRVWNYHADDFESCTGVSDDSSYQSLQSMNSFDSIYDSNAGREVEEIMKKRVNRDSLYRYQTDSPASYVRASPKSVDYLRGSPKTHSSSPKMETYNRNNSPKFEQELFELTNFPSSPGLSLRQLQGHRSFYGGKQ